MVDTDGWYDRREAAKVLRCAVNTIINRQNAGKLHPRWAVRRDCRGAERMQLVYDPKELVRFVPSRYVDRHRSPGETAALCFEAFGARKSIREIVIDLRETPDAVEALYQHWETGGGHKRVVTDTAWEALQQQLGPMDDVTDLVQRVRSLKEALKAKP